MNKLSSEFNKFKNFGIDLNEANKTTNRAKLTTKKRKTQLKKVSKIYKNLKTKIRKRQVKKSISLLKIPKNSKNYATNNGILQDLLKLLKYIIIWILEEKHINMK